MIKSFPLDIAHLIARLKQNTLFNVRLIDFRIHSINNDSFWQSKGVDPAIFNDFQRCIDHILTNEKASIKYSCLKIIKEMDLSGVTHLFFSVSVLEQFSLEYLISSLCIANEIKKLKPRIRILLFGSCPRQHIKKIMNKFQFIDAFLEDGNELSVECYLNDGSLNAPINGLTYRLGQDIIFSPLEKDKVNFNDYPMPDFSLFDKDSYRCRKHLILPYEMNRGCSKNCFYCYFTHKNQLSYKNINRIISDLKTLSQQFQTNAFHFVDGAINSDEQNLMEICDALTKKLPEIKWSAMARPNMSRSLLEIMKKAGCIHIRWGVEYGSERMLLKINKDTTPTTIKQTLKDSHELGIYNYITLLTGTAVENDEDIAQTIEFIGEIKPYVNSVQECVFMELGSFDISKLNNLLDGAGVLNQTRSKRYDELFSDINVNREDIIETLALSLSKNSSAEINAN